MTYRPVDVVEVLAWGRSVGAVALDPTTGWYAFEYRPEWIDSGVELAPIHMPNRRGTFEFNELDPATFHRLPAMLADALPDRFGNALVDAWMAEHGVPAARITPLDRLAYAADRAMGALEFRPPVGNSGDSAPTAVQLADLVVAARQVVTGQLADDDDARAALGQLIQVGTSAGGARAKAVLAYNPATSQVRSSYAALSDGFEHWLVKLDGVSSYGMDGHGDRLGESAPHGCIEYAYHLMATAAGVEMSPCRLLAEGPRRHFMTRRFDRGPDGRRVHMQSLCALAHLDFNMVRTHSYDQYLATVTALELGPDALAQAYRRMVFNAMAVNRDDHTKNLAFLLDDGGPWRLAPSFDVTYAYRADSLWTARHLMAINGRFDDVTLDDLFAVGERHEVPRYRRIVREVTDGVDAWQSFATVAEVDDDTRNAIAADIDRFRPR